MEVDIKQVKNHLRLRLCRSKNDMKTYGYKNEKKYSFSERIFYITSFFQIFKICICVGAFCIDVSLITFMNIVIIYLAHV